MGKSKELHAKHCNKCNAKLIKKICPNIKGFEDKSEAEHYLYYINETISSLHLEGFEELTCK